MGLPALNLTCISLVPLRSVCNSCWLSPTSSPPCRSCSHQQTLQNSLLSPFSRIFIASCGGPTTGPGAVVPVTSALQEAIHSFKNTHREETLTAGCWQELQVWFLKVYQASLKGTLYQCTLCSALKYRPAQLNISQDKAT